MIDYSKGKIYKIWSPSTDQIYIGSTTKQYLSQRLTGHVIDYKRWQNGKHNYVTSFELVKLEDHVIELIEDYPCQSKDQLHAREGHYIRLYKDVIVNKLVAGRTQREYNKEHYTANKDVIIKKNKQYREANKDEVVKKNKQYYDANKQSILEKVKQYQETNKQSILKKKKERYEANKDKFVKKQKQYYELNKDEIAKYKKEYRKANKDDIAKYKKEHYEANKQSISEKGKQPYHCPCGTTIRTDSKAQHERSHKHIEFMKSQQPQQ